MKPGPILYCGDMHGQFRHIIKAATELHASAVILLGDLQAQRPLDEELEAIADKVWLIQGNHDTDSVADFEHLWDSRLSDRNVDGRVVVLPDGTRLAGLGGVFRETVWYPSSSAARQGVPAFRNATEHAASTPRQDRWRGMQHRRHWSSIYPDILDGLANERADVLAIHEAPGYHRHGFPILDTLAQSLGARVVVHGHQHDCLESSGLWAEQGFRSYGVGLRGITAIDLEGNATVVVAGEQDEERDYRQRYVGVFKGHLP